MKIPLFRLTFSATLLFVAQAHGDDLSKPAHSVPTLEFRAQRTFTPDYRPVSVSLSADGRLLAVCLSDDGKPVTASDAPLGRLWDMRTGKEVARFGRPDFPVQNVRLSPDGRTVAFTNGNQGNFDIELFDVAQRKIVRTLTGNGHCIDRLMFSPDGKLLASDGHKREGVRLWDVATGKQLHRKFTKEADFRYGGELTFSPNNKTLAVATGDGVVHLLDIAKGQEFRQFLPPPGRYPPPSAIAFSPDGRLLALGVVSQNVITVWDTRDGKVVRQHTWERDHERPELARYEDQFSLGSGTMGLGFTADGRSLIAACHGMRVRVWENASGGLRYQIDEYMPFMSIAAAAPHFAGVVRHKHVCLWDGRTCLSAPRRGAPPDWAKVWSGLAGTDAAEAYALMRDLMAAPREATELIDKHLSTVVPVEAAVIGRLVRELDDDSFDVREKASRRLSELGEVARPALSDALTHEPPAETRRRIKELLDPLDRPADGERLRLLRAAEVLEIVGTPDARIVLQRLAEGEPNALLTREAKAAVIRLDTKSARSKD